MAEKVYTWPEFMPYPSADDFSWQPVESRTLTDMEVGTVIRSEFNTDEQEATCSLLLDQFQAAWFEAFEANVLNRGTVWFSFPCWISGEVQYRNVRMKARPKMSKISGLHSQYTLSLQVADRKLWSASIVDALMKFGLSNLTSWGNSVARTLNVVSGITNPPPGVFWG